MSPGVRQGRFAGLAALVGVGAVAALAARAIVPEARQRVRISPHEVHEFDAGGCHVTLNYGRPSKRGRQIWGGLVPWGHWWMPGADEATIITTSKPIVLEGLAVPAGDHTLYMLPDESVSMLIVSNEVGQFHTQYHADRNLGRVKLAMKHLDSPLAMVEEMTFTVEPEASGGRLTLAWDDRAYSAGFVVRWPLVSFRVGQDTVSLPRDEISGVGIRQDDEYWGIRAIAMARSLPLTGLATRPHESKGLDRSRGSI